MKREVKGTLAGSVDANGILHFSAKEGAEYFYTAVAVDNSSHTCTQQTTLPHSQVLLLVYLILSTLEHSFYLTTNASSNTHSTPLRIHQKHHRQFLSSAGFGYVKTNLCMLFMTTKRHTEPVAIKMICSRMNDIL